jgi:CheY-like chemotaxis protein
MTSEVGRILLAEDDPRDVELILTALGDYNLANEVATVSDGVEALDYLYRRGAYQSRPEGQPVAVVLDVKMPRVDGIEVLRIVKGDERLRMIPVILLTSSADEKDMLKSYQLGANAYVVKPVDFQRFADAVKELGLFWAVINHPPPEIH